MAEAAPAVVTPTPTTHPNAPQNAARPPADGAATATKPPEQGTPDWSAKYKQLETEHQKKVREQIVERRKWEADRKTTSERLAKLEALEKREAAARLNPPAFLQELYGEKWHEVVTEAKVNGVVPAQLLQAEFDKFRAEQADKEKQRAEESTKAEEARKQQATENARQTIFAEAASWYRSKASEYPLLAKIGAEPAVARTMSARIEHEFNQTGKILTTTEVADLIEGEVLEWVKEAGKHEKYKAKLQPPPASSTVVPSKQQQGTQQPAAARRSITNDITGSTAAKPPITTPAERRARAIAAFEAERERKKGH